MKEKSIFQDVAAVGARPCMYIYLHTADFLSIYIYW